MAILLNYFTSLLYSVLFNGFHQTFFHYCALFECHSEALWSKGEIWTFTSCNNITCKWFQAKVLRARERETKESDSPIIEALGYSSPPWLLHLIHSFLPVHLCPLSVHSHLIPCLCRHLIHPSVLSLPHHFLLSILTHFSPTTHELFLMLFVSLPCSHCLTVPAICLCHFLFKAIHQCTFIWAGDRLSSITHTLWAAAGSNMCECTLYLKHC